ncbi:MAG: PLDc N-terminal domain-containing protein [Verrucomicrobia bacterium]|nr:PLDc N-terminal domain-containing protein [Verrucomicrobiota bacterium]
MDAARNEPGEGNDRIVWVLVSLFGQVLGARIYFLARRLNRPPGFGRRNVLARAP